MYVTSKPLIFTTNASTITSQKHATFTATRQPIEHVTATRRAIGHVTAPTAIAKSIKINHSKAHPKSTTKTNRRRASNRRRALTMGMNGAIERSTDTSRSKLGGAAQSLFERFMMAPVVRKGSDFALRLRTTQQ
jgi:hypothetical protein